MARTQADVIIPSLNELSLDEKIGQIFMVASITDPYSEFNDALMARSPYRMEQEYIEQLIRDYHVGGVIFLGMGNPEQQISLINHFQALAKTPLLIGQDFEWGLSMRLKDTIRFPRNMTLGALNDDLLIYAMGKEIGNQMKHLGVHINFAPVVDVNNNPKNPVINDRSFGEIPEIVAHKGVAYMRGLQSTGILSCAKHFPGHGDTDVDSHLDLPRISHTKERLETIELMPFKWLVKLGVDAIMTAHLEIPALEKKEHVPASLSHAITTKLLREKLHFYGLIITDGLGMHGVMKHFQPGHIELQALLAGADILLCPVDVPNAVRLIKQALQDGRLTERELDVHVEKVIAAKKRVINSKIVEYRRSNFHSPQAHALKKQLYTDAVTLVRNQEAVLPLSSTSSTACITIGGVEKNSFASTLNNYQALPEIHVPASLDQVELKNLFREIQDYETIIVALYEMNKFASKNYGIADSTLTLLRHLAHVGKKIILVVFGNPYSLQFFSTIPTIIMAYEDDSDAQEAAAHGIFDPTKLQGILPISLDENLNDYI